jgi:hypothetical protein
MLQAFDGTAVALQVEPRLQRVARRLLVSYSFGWLNKTNLRFGAKKEDKIHEKNIVSDRLGGSRCRFGDDGVGDHN